MLRRLFSRLVPGRLCLVADDSAVIRDAARNILRDLNFHTAEAENGLEALCKCRRCRPDAILLSGSMRGMDGFEFLRALRDRQPSGMPKIIFCTADRDPAQIARAIDAGANDYVIKPFDRTILATKLENLGFAA